MPNKKHQNRPPSKDQLHGVIEKSQVQDRLRYPAERIAEIRQLATEHTDAEIAELHNKRGQRSSRGKPFTAKMIGWIRYKHRIAAVELKCPEELT